MVGQTVEKADIADLEAAVTGLNATDVRQLHTHLLTASRHHLIAFQNWPARRPNRSASDRPDQRPAALLHTRAGILSVG